MIQGNQLQSHLTVDTYFDTKEQQEAIGMLQSQSPLPVDTHFSFQYVKEHWLDS